MGGSSLVSVPASPYTDEGMGLVAALVLASCAGQLSGDAPDQAPLSFQSRASVVLVVVTPKGTAPGVGSAVLHESAGLAFESATDLQLRSMEQAGVDEEALRACPSEGQLGCWVAALARVAPSEAKLAPRLLLVVSFYPVESDRHVLHSSLLDLERAERTLSQLRDQGGEDWRERAEDIIYAEAVHAEPVRAAELGGTSLRAYFEERVRGEFASMLESGGYFGALGRMVVEGTPTGLRVSLDGRVLGTSRLGQTEITNVPVGSRVVGFGSGDEELFGATAEVEAGRTTRIVYVPPPPPRSSLRRAAFWGGTGLAAVGVGLAVAATLQAGAAITGACVTAPGTEAGACPHVGLPTLGFGPGGAPSVELAALNPSGPSTAALAAGLFTAGSVTALSILLFGEPHQSPWVQLGVGLATGLGAFLVVTALDPRAEGP